MAPFPHQGQLTSWKDDRGFGFIKSEDGGKEIFLHISALPKTSRRPQVGDTILYEKVVQPDGKIRAVRASIEGVVPTPRQTTRPISTARATSHKSKQGNWLKAFVGIAGLATVAVVTAPFIYKSLWAQPEASAPPSPVVQSETPAPLSPVVQSETPAPLSPVVQPETSASPLSVAQPATPAPSPPIAQSDTAVPPSPIASVMESTCDIKGNISISTSKRLYHVPGMEDYDITRIEPDKGERWFCTEAEAIAAGWSRAPR